MIVREVIKLREGSGRHMVRRKEKKMPRDPIVIEKCTKNDSVYRPDLPDCVATGATVKQTPSRLKAALKLHLEALKKQGAEIAEPSTGVEYIDIAI